MLRSLPVAAAVALLLTPVLARGQPPTGERLGGSGHRAMIEIGGVERRAGGALPTIPRSVDPPTGGAPPPAEAPSFGGVWFALYGRARLLVVPTSSEPSRAGDALTLDGELAWRGIVTTDEIVRAANPALSLALGWASEEVTITGAIGVALPLSAAQPWDLNERRLYSLLRAAQGHGDVWLSTEDSVGVFVRGQVDGSVEWLFYGGELAGALVPTLRLDNRRYGPLASVQTDPLIEVVQGRAWLGARPTSWLALGVRGQAVLYRGALESPRGVYGYRYPPLDSCSGSPCFFLNPLPVPAGPAPGSRRIRSRCSAR